jgi:hypothetical protein
MMDVVRYEQALKQRFLSSIPIQPVSPAQAILDELSGPLPAVFERQGKVLAAHNPLAVLETHLYEALSVMKAKDILAPVSFIVLSFSFTFSRYAASNRFPLRSCKLCTPRGTTRTAP